MRGLDDVHGDVLGVIPGGGEPRDSRPVSGGDAVKPVAHRTTGSADFTGNFRCAPKRVDDLRRVHIASLPDILAMRNNFDARPYGDPCASNTGTLAGMRKKPPSVLKLRIARRLEAARAEFGISQEAMAQRIGATRSAWSNWVSPSSPEMPAEEAMIRLCQEAREWGLNMDWLYRGVTDGLNAKAAIRLSARVHGLDPDSATGSVLELVADPT